MITYPVVQHASISCVPPPDESVATPVAPQNENSRTATELECDVSRNQLINSQPMLTMNLTCRQSGGVCLGAVAVAVNQHVKLVRSAGCQ